MSDDTIDELGPVDYLVVEFPAGASHFTGEMAEELAALVDAGTIRVLDIMILAKDADGSVEALEIDDLDVARRACARSRRSSRPSSPKKTSSTSPQRWSPARWPEYWFGRTAGRLRSRQPPVDRVAS